MRSRCSAAVLTVALAVVVTLVSGFGCSAGGGKAADASFEVMGFDVVLGDLPPGCPESVTPNEKGVGRKCTERGGECPTGLVCACDTIAGYRFPEGTPCLCTIPLIMKACSDPTVPADFCGSNATCCGYLDVAALCVPNSCLYDNACPVLTMP